MPDEQGSLFAAEASTLTVRLDTEALRADLASIDGLEGRYDAVQAEDGTWTILDVPIVHQGSIPLFNKRGEKVRDFEVTPEWMERAIAAASRKEGVDGFMGRSFLDHHAGAGSQSDAGFIRPTRVGAIAMSDEDGNAEQIPALLANLVRIPDEVYQESVKTGRLPYRSIESLRPDSAFIDGLALMATRSPHFKLPMLTIRSETPHGMAAVASDEPELLIACGSEDHAAQALRRHNMADELELKAPEVSEGGAAKAMSLDEVIAMVGELPDEQREKVKEALGKGVETVEGLPPEEMETMDQPKDDEGEAPAIGAAGYDAKLEAKVAMLEGKVREREAKDEAESLIASAVGELKGYILGEDNEAVIRAQFDKGGAQGLEGFKAAVLAHAPVSEIGGPGGEGEIPADLGTEPLTGEIEAYTDPADRKAAIKAHKQWEGFKAADYPMDGMNYGVHINSAVAKARATRS